MQIIDLFISINRVNCSTQ